MDIEEENLPDYQVSESEILVDEVCPELCYDHDEVQAVLDMMGASSSAAELQGYVTALFATGAELNASQWLTQYLSHYPANKVIDREDRAFLIKFYQLMGEALYSDDLSYQLLLPSEHYPLSVRTAEMALWCEGFVFGVGNMLPQHALQKHPELMRVIADILAISQAEEDIDTIDDADEVDAAEEDFCNLVEYLKVAALTFYTELVMFENPKLGDIQELT